LETKLYDMITPGTFCCFAWPLGFWSMGTGNEKMKEPLIDSFIFSLLAVDFILLPLNSYTIIVTIQG
jgi:hypothetical protein